MFNHGRKKVLRIIALFMATLFLCVFSACTSNLEKNEHLVFDGFSVHYLDVGEGDCILIRFPDHKNMLIDSGDKSQTISDYVIDYLKYQDVEKIDYLLITHPDSDHSGNALDIISEFSIGSAFIPYILEDRLELYQTYKNFYEKLTTVTDNIIFSDSYEVIKGEDYGVAFLTPLPKSVKGSSYMDFNGAVAPTPEQSNALSPIVYVEYKGVRFLFTGDTTASQEMLALEQVKIMGNFYKQQGVTVNLENIEFLKVSHHGADDASSLEFLKELSPKNAVISVGGNNNYGHPTKKVLERLQIVNPEYNLWRTDVHGTISVNVKSDGTFEIITDKKIA